MEVCNCDYLCPCIYTRMQAAPTRGDCIVAMAFRIDGGRWGDTPLAGLAFVAVARSDGAMGVGNWKLGLILDARATDAQREALMAICSGAAGGPMAAFQPLVGEFLGVESHPIEFVKEPMRVAVVVPDRVDEAVAGSPMLTDPGRPICLDDIAHPANSRLALGTAERGHIHAFGIDWDDDTGGRCNGHFAPFHWQA